MLQSFSSTNNTEILPETDLAWKSHNFREAIFNFCEKVKSWQGLPHVFANLHSVQKTSISVQSKLH